MKGRFTKDSFSKLSIKQRLEHRKRAAETCAKYWASLTEKEKWLRISRLLEAKRNTPGSQVDNTYALHTEKAKENSLKALLSDKTRRRGVDNRFALCWSIKSPEGVIFQFKNLTEFVRTHCHLFTDDQLRKVPSSGDPRILAALRSLSPRRSGIICHHAHGWTWHVNNEADPIAREHQPPGERASVEQAASKQDKSMSDWPRETVITATDRQLRKA